MNETWGFEGRQGGERQVFHATRRNSAVWVAALVGFMAVLFAAGALAMQQGAWVMGLAALVFGWLAWLLLRPFLGSRPILEVGPEGIGGWQFKGQVIPWRDIADLESTAVQGQQHLQIHLHDDAPSREATRSWLQHGTRRAVMLNPLRAADRPKAVAAAMQAFERHAGVRARAAMQERIETIRRGEALDARLRELTPRPWALYLVTALNVGVWLLNVLGGMSPVQPAPADLFDWGANSASAVVRDGECWRLLTATVLHGGIMHLLLNLYALWIAGAQVCRWFGNLQFLMIYWGSALAGSALSLHFSSQQAVSVGASGAVFGVLGALLVGMYQHKERLPKGKVAQLFASQGAFVAFALVQGFTRQGIDNAAHVGGLLAGAVMAWLLIEMVDDEASDELRRSRRWLACGGVALVAWGLVWSAQPGVDHRQGFGTQRALQQLSPRMNEVEAALRRDADAVRDGKMSEADFMQAIARRYLPAYRDIHRQLAELGSSASLPVVDDLRTFYGLSAELMALEVERQRNPADAARAQAKVNELTARLKVVSARLQAANPSGRKALKP